MSTELATVAPSSSPSMIRARVQERLQVVLDVMANVLEEGKDYGKIPGTDKPTLYKPGAEKLLLTFRLAAASPTVYDESVDDGIRYRIDVPIQDDSGRVIAVGIGACSTDEEKYKWRRPVCEEEFDATPESQRRLKWRRGQGKAYQEQQVRTSPADLANTVLKMAHKRALIHSTLLATGASSVFNQDTEDFKAELEANVIDGEVIGDTAPQPQVQRASARHAAAAPSAPGAKVTAAAPVRDVVPGGKDKTKPTFWVLTLQGDLSEYTTKDTKVRDELLKFKGTDHLLRVTYEDNDWNGKTYHNIKSFAVDVPVPDAPAPAPAAAPAKATGDLTSADIPF